MSYINTNIINPIRDDLKSAFLIQSLIFLGACIGLFTVFKLAVLVPVKGDVQVLSIVLTALIACYGRDLYSSHMPKAMLVIVRTISTLFGVYLLLSFPTFDETLAEYGFSAFQMFFIEYGRFIGFACAIAGWFYPAWGLITIVMVLYIKGACEHVFGYVISVTDYKPLIEMYCILVLSAILWLKSSRLKVSSTYIIFKQSAKDALQEDNKSLTILEMVTLLGVSAHLANYFYSGLKKILIAENPVHWAWENTTYNLLPNAQALGQLPIGFSEEFSTLVYDALIPMNVFNNYLIHIIQLFAIIAICRIRWALWTTLFYDLTHVVIFIVSGIFFYKWIILNISIVMALETIRNKTVRPLFALFLMSFIIISPAMFFVAKLGWWDTPALNVESIYAITKDGRFVEVPTNFWGSFSVTIAQQRLVWDKEQGYLPTGTYGIIFGIDNVRRAKACDFDKELLNAKPDAIEKTFAEERGEKIVAFIQRYHEWAKEMSGDKNNWSYNLYPHHIFSFPWTFADFRALDIDDIVAYRYSIKSYCDLKFKEGRLEKTFIKEGYYDIPIRN